KPLEIAVAFGVLVVGVQVDTLAIRLPDLDESISNRVSLLIQDPPAQMRDLPDGWRDSLIDNDEVVIRVQRQFVGIKRSFGLPRGAHQVLSECARHGEKSRAQAETPQEHPTRLCQQVDVWEKWRLIHV